VLQQKTPKHIRLILAVEWKRRKIGDTMPIPSVTNVFTAVPKLKIGAPPNPRLGRVAAGFIALCFFLY
jgi:hypothetical protein